MAIERKKPPLFQEKRRRRRMSKNRPFSTPFFWMWVRSNRIGERPPPPPPGPTPLHVGDSAPQLYHSLYNLS